MSRQGAVSHRRLIGALVGTTLFIAGAYIAVAGPVSSDADPASCQGSTANISFGGGTFGSTESRLSSTGEADLPSRRTFELSAPLESGTYDLDAVSYDGYPGRANVQQFSEFWFVQFVSADGTVLASSATTDDVPDGVEEATVASSLGQVVWAGPPAVRLRVIHGAEGARHINSVGPVCLGVSVATDVDSGTQNPGGGQGSETDGGTGTDNPTEGTVPTEVGGRVQLPPTDAAQPADADPAFTG